MIDNRPFNIKGPDKLNDIKNKIINLDFSSDIDQIVFDGKNVLVYIKNNLDDSQINQLKNILINFNIVIHNNYSVNSPHPTNIANHLEPPHHNRNP
jgi:hypothetical protein